MSINVTIAPESPPVVLTEVALEKTRAFMVENDGQYLRLGVRGGGCSGFQYNLNIDNPTEKDVQWEQDGVGVICAPEAVPYLIGATLDYVDKINGSGFEFSNPNATSACGCGSSFRMDDQAGCDSDAVDPGDVYGV